MKLTDGPITETQVVVLPWDSFPSESTRFSEQQKRIIDVTLCLIAAVICTPIILLCCLLIMAESRGCPIYLQKRIGKNGKVFSILKLRTMAHSSDPLGPVTQENDARITRVGGILRASKIDELPQLWNILSGEMSIIGPRPLSTVECESIEDLGFSPEYPGFYPTVRPGLIGLEQVNRTRQLSYAERFELNYQYECTTSMMVDMQIFADALRQCQQVCFLAFVTGMAEFVFASFQLFY